MQTKKHLCMKSDKVSSAAQFNSAQLNSAQLSSAQLSSAQLSSVQPNSAQIRSAQISSARLHSLSDAFLIFLKRASWLARRAGQLAQRRQSWQLG
jgi:uncharacterized protein YjbI with pentapeptide repeats